MDLKLTVLSEKKPVKNYKLHLENGQILKLTECKKCGTEVLSPKVLCSQCKIKPRKYKPEDYQKRKHKILQVFTPVDKSPLVRPKKRV